MSVLPVDLQANICTHLQFTLYEHREMKHLLHPRIAQIWQQSCCITKIENIPDNDNLIKFISLVNGQIHSLNDEPALILRKNEKQWCLGGKRHRGNDKPAMITDDYRSWWIRGKRHRENGMPAVERDNEENEWWIHGRLERDWNEEYFPVYLETGILENVFNVETASLSVRVT